MDKKMKETFVKQMLLSKEELALQTMELMADKMDLQQRIDKAVKYIEKNKLINNLNYMDNGVGDLFNNVLNILKGDDIDG